MHAVHIAAYSGLRMVRADPPEPSGAPVKRAGALERHTRAIAQTPSKKGICLGVNDKAALNLLCRICCTL